MNLDHIDVPKQLHMDVGAFEGPFRLVRFLGEGAFGSVGLYAANDGKGPLLAIKITKARPALQETAILRRVSTFFAKIGCHPHVTCMYGFHVDKRANRAYIASEYMTGGSLATISQPLWEKENTLYDVSTFLCNTIMWQLAKGLQYLHKRGVAHHDIKPENVLANAEHTIFQLADVGVSCFAKPSGNKYACINELMLLEDTDPAFANALHDMNEQLESGDISEQEYDRRRAALPYKRLDLFYLSYVYNALFNVEFFYDRPFTVAHPKPHMQRYEQGVERIINRMRKNTIKDRDYTACQLVQELEALLR